MIDVERGIVELLRSHTAIVAIVGTRIDSFDRSSPTRPNLVYQRIGTRRTHNNDGVDGLARATIQLSAYADTRPAAKSLANIIGSPTKTPFSTGGLDGYRGTVTTDDGSIRFQGVFLTDERDAEFPPQDGKAQRVAGVIFTFEIAYSSE